MQTLYYDEQQTQYLTEYIVSFDDDLEIIFFEIIELSDDENPIQQYDMQIQYYDEKIIQ